MPSLQRAQLLQAQKNMEISGNLPPRFTVLDGFSDDHLHEVLDASRVDPTCVGGARELVSLVRAKELAQAAIAAAAAEHAEQRTRVPKGGEVMVIYAPDEGGQATGVAHEASSKSGHLQGCPASQSCDLNESPVLEYTWIRPRRAAHTT